MGVEDKINLREIGFCGVSWPEPAGHLLYWRVEPSVCIMLLKVRGLEGLLLHHARYDVICSWGN